MLCSSHSVLEVYAGKYLYVVYLNNKIHKNVYIDTNLKIEQEESIRNMLCFVLYLYKISVLDSYGRYEIMLQE